MKKSIVLALATMSLMACRNDDKEPTLVGIWKYKAEVIYDGKTGKVLSTKPADACNSKTTLEFTEDGKYISHTYSTSLKGVCQDFGETIYTYTHSASSNNFKIEKGTFHHTITISKLTDTELETGNSIEYDANKDGIIDFPVSVYTKVK